MFAPIVIALRKVMGDKPFMKLRGKLIAQHARIINQAASQWGIERDKIQDLLRLARDNGKRLGLLA